MGIDDWKDPIERLIKDHKDVSEYFETVKGTVEFLSNEESWNETAQIENFFNHNITKHFKLEEEIIFPTILLKCPMPKSIKLIMELQREHGMILEKLEEFQKIVENVFPFDEGTKKARLNALVKEILEDILQHAAKEDENLLPILKENIHLFK